MVAMVVRSHSSPALLPMCQSFCRDNAKVQSKNQSSSDRKSSYQVFRICKERCKVLCVTIEKGIGITRGKIKDWLYSADPYVSVQVLGTPNGVKRTEHVKDSCDPKWGETLLFYVDPERDRLLEFVLYDLNRTVNEEIGREVHDFHKLIPNNEENVVISYRNGSKIKVRLLLKVNPNPSLRFGLDLCLDEKQFLSERKGRISDGITALLGTDRGPKNADECPRICLMTSGGGFRAMIAYCGAYKAMHDAGIMDTVTYISALSGSSWYLSTLYSHPSFPEDKHISHTIIPEIKSAVEKYWQVHLSPPWSSKYLKKIIAKSVKGQPVSFTDFFGYLVGQQLLKKRMKARLSDQREKVLNGSAPLPLYTCLHVKSNVSAMIFQEWYEFTPFEVGIPKYGVFMNSKDFASKFYVGQKVKSFPEVRLHFLYGIWGSAFTILLKRLVQEKGRNGEKEVLKMILGSSSCTSSTNTNKPGCDMNDAKLELDDAFGSCNCPVESCICVSANTSNSEATNDKESYWDVGCDGKSLEAVFFECDDFPEEGDLDYDTEEDVVGDSANVTEDRKTNSNKSSVPTDFSENDDSTPYGTPPSSLDYVGSLPKEFEMSTDEYLIGSGAPMKSNAINYTSDDDDPRGENAVMGLLSNSQFIRRMDWRKKFNEKCKTITIPKIRDPRKKSQNTILSPISPKLVNSDTFFQFPKWPKSEKLSPMPPDNCIGIEENDRSRWGKVLERALTTTAVDSRAFRAGVILNPLRGLTAVENNAFHIERDVPSPVQPTDKIDCDFKGYRESMETDDKKIYLVDSGLSFNLPFPVALRPQREIELYITFDFSSRKTDSTPPFRELLLAEKWASLHNIPFPPIKESVKHYIDLDKHVREIYVFKDPSKLPSEVPVIIFFPLVNYNFRHYKAPGIKRETVEEKAFGDFNIFDGTNDYAIWRFVYPNLSFDRLTKMMEFNVANNIDIIKEEIRQIIEKKQLNM